MRLLEGLDDLNLLDQIPAVQNRRQLYALLSSTRQRTMMRPHIYPQYRNKDWDIILSFVSYCNLEYAEVVSLLKKNKNDLKISELYRTYQRPSREMAVFDLVLIRFELNSRYSLIGKAGVNGDYKMLCLDFSDSAIQKFVQFGLDRPTVKWKELEIKNVLRSWERSLIDLREDLMDDFHFKLSAHLDKHPFWSCFFRGLTNTIYNDDMKNVTRNYHQLVVNYLENLPQGKRRWGGKISFEALRTAIYSGEPKITRVPSGLSHSHVADEIIRSIKNSNDSTRSGTTLWEWISEQESQCLDFALVTIQEFEILKYWHQIDDCFENAIARTSISFYPNHKFATALELENFIYFIRNNPDFLYSPSNIIIAITEYESRK